MLSSYVCPSVRLTHVGIVLKQLNVGSRKQRHTIAQELDFSYADFRPIPCYISETMQDTTYLLWNTNKKPYALALFLVTFSDL